MVFNCLSQRQKTSKKLFKDLEQMILGCKWILKQVLKTVAENETDTASKTRKQRILCHHQDFNGFRKLLPEMKRKLFQRLENKIHQTATGF